MSLEELRNEEDEHAIEDGNEYAVEELKQVHEMLAELEAMQPLLHEQVTELQLNMDQLTQRLQDYDEKAEQQSESGELEGTNAFTVARAMNDLAGSIEAFMQDKELLLNTRMVLEDTIADLRERAKELLAQFQGGTLH